MKSEVLERGSAQRSRGATLASIANRFRLFHVAGAAIVLAYFFQFARIGLAAGFAADDPMNIYSFWSRGVGELLRNLVLFFTTYGRPMGGVYYLPLYHFFGLNPFPYHVATLCLLVVNIWLAYRFGALISGSRLTGGLCSFFVAYHARLVHLIYLPSFIFDVLCFTFYFLAFNYYLSIRTRGVPLNKRQIAAFLLLYIGALDSKEMAVTLPVLVLLYEAFWHAPGRWSPGGVARWARTAALPALLAGLVTAVYILGKTFGSDALVKMEGYTPRFTLDRYFDSTTQFMSDLFYQVAGHGFFNPKTVVLVAALLLSIAWRTRQRHLFLMALFVFITPLPISFLPGRGGACLYIPLVGWAVFAASVLVLFSEAVAKTRALQRVPMAVAQGALVLCAMAAQWTLSARQTAKFLPWLAEQNQLTASVLRQIRSVQPSVKPGSSVYVVNDVFDSFDTYFLFMLTYHDRSVHVWLARYSTLPPAEIERMDYIFTFENGTLKRLKGA